jgi:hypothetical protein
MDSTSKLYIKNNIITFKAKFDKDLDDNYYDIIKNTNINTIHFNSYFKGNILKLPDTITCITFDKILFNGILVLPPKLEILVMPSKYLYKLSFPDTLKLLIIKDYDYDLDNLPSNLHELRLLGCNKVKINMFPVNLKKLILGFTYEQPIDFFPEGLQVFIMSAPFNYSIENISNNLITLDLGYHFQQDINLLPNSIKYLSMFTSYSKKIYKYPDNLEELIINNEEYDDTIFTIDFNLIPKTIKQIKLYGSSESYNLLNLENINNFNNFNNLNKIIVYRKDLYKKIKSILINKEKILLFDTTSIY